MVRNRDHFILRMIMYNASLPMLGLDLLYSLNKFGCIKCHHQRIFIVENSNCRTSVKEQLRGTKRNIYVEHYDLKNRYNTVFCKLAEDCEVNP